MLRDLNFDINPDLYTKWKGDISLDWDEIDKIKIPKYYRKIMHPFQRKTLQLLKHFGFRAAVGLPVGSGKSLIAMSVLDWKESFPVLIITTSSTTYNLKREYKKWVDRGDTIFIPKSSADLKFYNRDYDIVIVNFEKFSRQIEFLKKESIPSQKLKDFKKNKFRMIIVDEVHKISNENSKIYHAIKFLSIGAPYFIGLSATLLNNKTKELFNLCSILSPKLFPSRYSFLNRYCDPKTIKLGKKTIRTFDGLTNEAELHSVLKNNLLIRFKKEEVMPDLPPVISSIIPLDLNNYKEYRQLEKDFEKHIDKNSEDYTTGLEKMQQLLKASYEGKLDSCVDFVEDLLDNTDKVVVFAHNKEVVSYLMNHFKKRCLKIDGTVPMDKRLDLVDQFVEDDKIEVFILNLVAGKEGLDGMQKVCTNMCFIQHPFTPGGLEQAIGRLNRMHKIGPTNVFHLIGRNTIDEKVLEIISEKQSTFDSVIDGEFEGTGVVSNMYKELVRKYKRDLNGL